MKELQWGQVVWFKIAILFPDQQPKDIMIHGKVVGCWRDSYRVRYHSPKNYEEITQEFQRDKLLTEI